MLCVLGSPFATLGPILSPRSMTRSPASSERPSLGSRILPLVLAFTTVAFALTSLALPRDAGGWILWGLTVIDLLVVSSLALAMARRRPSPAPTGRPAVTVIVAAWNERASIEATVAGLLAQSGVELEVVVVDDGSTDGTADLVAHRFAGSSDRVRVVRAPHGGKGAALERGRAVARHGLIATVDADTTLEPGALALLAAPFADPSVLAAGGAVLVRDAQGPLRRFQFLEYLSTTWVRAAWAELGMLEQLPGAFSMFRRAALAEAGGFPIDSLTEDYEVGYRLYEAAARAGRTAKIGFVPEARAWTAPPDDLRGFVRQRTRWFAGFLSTWVRFAHLVLRPFAGRFGMVRLPLKLIDALAPIVLAVSLVVSVARGSLVPLLLALGARAAGELALFVAARQLSASAPSPFGRALEHGLAAISAPTYGLFRALVVLRAFPFAALRVRTWERSRQAAEAIDVATLSAE